MNIATCWVSSLEKVFPEQSLVGREILCGSALRGERFNVQLAFRADDGLRDDFFVEWESDLKENIRCYQVQSVPVRLVKYKWADDDFLSDKPGLYPDLLEICSGRAEYSPGLCSCLWFEITVPENAAAGEHKLCVTLKNEAESECVAETSFSLNVIPATLPPQRLIHTEWFHCDSLAVYYGTEVFSERHWEIMGNYIRQAAYYGVNMLLTPLFTPPLDTAVGSERPTVQLVDIYYSKNGYSFDFSKLDRYIKLALDCGIKYFEFPHLFTQWGSEHAPKIIVTENGKSYRRFGWETNADSAEYAEFLQSFLPAVKSFMKEKQLLDNCLFHISDEPDEKHIESYRKAVQTVLPLLKGCKTFDALSEYSFYDEGLVQIPVPDNEHAEEFYRNGVSERWVYYCCGQLNRVCNRMIAMPSYRNRALGLQLFRYQISGFLHWGYNFWFNYLSRKPINPFFTTDAGQNFPAGDPFLVYPGNDGKPMSSIRQLVLFDALQDLRALQLLAETEGFEKTAEWLEGEIGYKISFTNYPRSTEDFHKLREAINRRIADILK